jgi:hypothetical protein
LNRETVVMRLPVMSLLCTALILIGLWTPSARATEPALLYLEQMGGQRLRLLVETKTGETTSPTRGKGFDKWALQPGATLDPSVQPRDVTVELYRGEAGERVLLCSIIVRYYRDANGAWVPYYRLDQEALVKRTADGRWQPVTTGGGTLIVITSNTLPNAEGFYPSLEFIPSSDLLQIDSWIVR